MPIRRRPASRSASRPASAATRSQMLPTLRQAVSDAGDRLAAADRVPERVEAALGGADDDGGQGQRVLYSPLVVEDGDVLRANRILDLQELSSGNAASGTAVPVVPALLEKPQVRGGRDRESVVISAVEPGSLFAGKYRVEKMIGTGGMGEVFEAHDRKLGRRVAVKLLLPTVADPNARARFVREVQVAAALTFASDSLPVLMSVLDQARLMQSIPSPD